MTETSTQIPKKNKLMKTLFSIIGLGAVAYFLYYLFFKQPSFTWSKDYVVTLTPAEAAARKGGNFSSIYEYTFKAGTPISGIYDKNANTLTVSVPGHVNVIRLVPIAGNITMIKKFFGK